VQCRHAWPPDLLHTCLFSIIYTKDAEEKYLAKESDVLCGCALVLCLWSTGKLTWCGWHMNACRGEEYSICWSTVPMEPKGDFSTAADTIDDDHADSDSACACSPVYSGTPRLLLFGADQASADALSKAVIDHAQVRVCVCVASITSILMALKMPCNPVKSLAAARAQKQCSACHALHDKALHANTP
jgi:hypothetical protein